MNWGKFTQRTRGGTVSIAIEHNIGYYYDKHSQEESNAGNTQYSSCFRSQK